MATAKINWALQGARVAEITPLEIDEATKKYKAGSNTYVFDTLIDGTAFKGPKPNTGKNEDTYKSLESTSAQTIRVKVNPETITLVNTATGTDLKTETGAAAEQVYPEFTISAGNPPRLAAGTESVSIKEYLKLQTDWQKHPVLIRFDMGKDTSGANIGTIAGAFKLGDINYSPKGKTQEADSLVFTGITIDIGMTELAAASYLPFGFKAGGEVALGALAAENFTKIAAGEAVII